MQKINKKRKRGLKRELKEKVQKKGDEERE